MGLLIFGFSAKAQSPGGISLKPAVWYSPNNASATTWLDNGDSSITLTNQGSVTVNPGDIEHNFHKWTTGYSSANYYVDAATQNPVFGVWNDGGITTSASTDYANGYYYMPITAFGVARPTAVANGLITGIDNELGNGAEPGFGVRANGAVLNPRAYRFGNGFDKTAGSLDVRLNSTAVYFYHPPGGGSTAGTGNLIIGLNGTNTTIAGVSARSSVGGPHLTIGNSNFSFGAFQGDIQEVIWYKATLTSAQKNKIETYLAIKYGTTLSHDYVSNAFGTVYSLTSNNGYASNIAGIGRDDANGGLYQKQSNSTNPGKQVLIGVGGLANTNAANAGTLDNGQYLVWGDNGLSKSFSRYTPALQSQGINLLMKAVWKVQNTGNVGVVRVAWPAGRSNLSLIQNTTSSFTTGSTVTNMAGNTMIVNGVTYNYADVTLSDGQYFTFGTLMEHAPGGVFAGLSYWYRADKDAANTGNGTNVTSWTDFVAGTIAGQMGTNPYPLYHTGSADYFNFNPGINFTSGNQSLGNTTVRTLSSLDYDIFSFTKEGMSGSGFPRFFSSLVNNNQLSGDISRWDAIGLWPNGYVERRDSVYGYNTYSYLGDVRFATDYSSIMYYHLTDYSASMGLNGAPNGAPRTNTHGWGHMNGGLVFGSTQYTIGGVGNGSDNAGFIGNIGELIIYGAGSLTPQQRNRVDAYLAIKYGITLDTAESYLSSAAVVVWDSTADAPFYHNVAGIARDTISALYQKQSKSQMPNVDSQVVIGLGDIYATNIANPGTISNGKFLLWGDNGQTIPMSNTAATYKTFTYNGSSNNRRMTRVWKVRNTNMLDSVKIRFPQASVGTTTIPGEGPNAGYAIIFASDSTFSQNVTVTTLSVNGGDFDVKTAFPDGVSYFTYGKVLDTVPPPDLCTGTIYLAQDDPTTLRSVDISSNPFGYPAIGSPSVYKYNAIGVNPQDGYIYGMRSRTGQPNLLLKIDPRDGSVTNLGEPAGLASVARMTSGGFDSAGNYYVKPLGNNAVMYKINLSTLTATPISLSLSFKISDMAYNVKDSLFYCVFASGRFATINPVNGVVTPIGSAGSIPSGTQIYGGMYSSASGAIYGANNAGGFYQFNTTTGQRVLLSSAPSTTNNDGAHCVDAPLQFLSDLYVTKTTTATGYIPGETITYTVVAGNNGPFGVLNAQVIDSVPGGIPDSNMTYTAVASTGSATTVTGTQSGSIADTVNIPKGGTVTYTVSLVIPSGFAGDLENIAKIIPPSVNSYDSTMTNNSDTISLAGTLLPIISGTIFDDTTGLTDGSVNGPELQQNIGLKVLLVEDNADTVTAQTTINTTNGFYGFYSIPSGNYHVILTTNSYAVGAAAPASAELPSGWAATGEFIGTGTGNDGNPDGMLAVTVSTSNITNANFGIDELPTAGSGKNIYLTNYGANQPITLRANSFTNITPSNDPDGRVDSILIKTFPVGINTINVNGTNYTSTPIEIPTDSDGDLIVPVDIYPTSSDSGTVNINYFAIDNAGVESAETGIGTTVIHLVKPVDTCYEPVQGTHFSWVYPSAPPGIDTVKKTITQPPSNYGFSFDIDSLDNSFNMVINGVKLAVHEIQFQTIGTTGINIKFKDGDKYGEGGIPQIYELQGTPDYPIVRVVISPHGEVSMYGSKTNGGPLFPLKLFNGNLFNAIPWNNNGTNTIVVTQAVVGPTTMAGYGYGRNMTPCTNEISGTVYNDANGLNDNAVNGAGLDQDLGLNVVLVDGSSDTVVAVSAVNTTDGSYSFLNVLANSYSIILTTANPAVGDIAPSATLPGSWVNTGEFLGTGAGSDGTPDGILDLTVNGDDLSNANFGILLLRPATVNPDLMNKTNSN